MKILLAAAVTAFAACSRRAPAPPAPKGALQTAVERAVGAPACAGKIPGQWSYSWPLPVARGGHVLYRIFFFGRDGDPQNGFTFHQAEGDALLSADGNVLECRRGDPGAPLPQTPLRDALSLEARTVKERRLFGLAEDVGGLYVAARPLSDEEKKRVAEYSGLLLQLSEPEHRKAYESLSPDFWAWMGKNAVVAP